MARRRFLRNKHSPDRGWVVGFSQQTITMGTTDQRVGGAAFFDFDDIDADGEPGVIDQDKSDWFVKRVILDTYAAVAFANTTATDTARVWSMAMGVMPNAEFGDTIVNGTRVFTSVGYNSWARLFRTWSRPVYAGGVLPYSENNILAAEPFPVNSYGVTAPFWGPSRIEADFEVTNAGLRNRQSCVWIACADEGPGTFDWDQGDQLLLVHHYRILLQKRRV